ncbi:MAG TPA: LysM peptidoglycan-binding domain-containing protein [Gammaproteobacteria bacterium]|nr:LysM peptidoglycan-binding domain-containing protein [Gammaproteobacteria bacterium]
MTDNKVFAQTLIRFLPALLPALLLGCSSTPEEPARTVAEPEPVAVTPAREQTPPPAPAPVVVQRDYPERYVVKRGDTLWDIAKRFLKDPWLWPEVWHINPKIRNPHLIYPGDVLVLYFDENGKPFITLDGAGGYAPPARVKTVKLSPEVRYETLDKSINTIPRSALAPFLGGARVVSEQDLKRSPYIISTYEQHLVTGSGDRIYAMGVTDQSIGVYDVVRPIGEYRDPHTGELLGYEVARVADARLVRFGDGEDKPASLDVIRARQEIFNKDVLLPKEEVKLDYNFIPRPPVEEVRGEIMSVFQGVAQIGQYNIVVLNIGEREGIEPGHVLAIYQRGERVRDPSKTWSWSKVELPDERAGILMVFRTYEKMSYALVMEAQRPLHIRDWVTNP